MDYIGTTLVNLLQQTAFCNLTLGNRYDWSCICIPLSGYQERI